LKGSNRNDKIYVAEMKIEWRLVELNRGSSSLTSEPTFAGIFWRTIDSVVYTSKLMDGKFVSNIFMFTGVCQSAVNVVISGAARLVSACPNGESTSAKGALPTTSVTAEMRKPRTPRRSERDDERKRVAHSKEVMRRQ
jgi:hypothetical protein